MEVFGARPQEPSDACLAEINACDLFVGIYAHRYGYVPDGSHVSISEAEFYHAQTNNKPTFCFLVDEHHPWPPRMIEDEPGRSKLHNFKTKIGSALVRDTFTTPEDLAYKIAASLGRYLSTINNTQTMPKTVPDLNKGHTEFFDKILSEIAILRFELQLKHLLQPSDQNTQAIQPMNEKLPSDLEGCWIDSRSGSTLYARFLGEDLVVPYCYGGASKLTGVFFNFRRRAKNIYFARYKWINFPIQGFAYIERLGSDRASGRWWYSEYLSRQTLEDLERFYPNLNLARMNALESSRSPLPKMLPQWVNDFFSMPKNELLNLLQTDS